MEEMSWAMFAQWFIRMVLMFGLLAVVLFLLGHGERK